MSRRRHRAGRSRDRLHWAERLIAGTMRHRPHRAEERSGDRVHWAERLIEAGVLFLLVFTPLAYGTVEPWSEALAELVVLGMAVAWMMRMLADWELRVELPPGWLPATLFLALVVLQAVPLPSALVARISPWTADLHRSAAAYAGSVATTVPLSLDPHATWWEALKLLAVAAFFLIVYNTYRMRGQVRRAIWTMIIMGTLLSVFGIVQRMSWNGRFYWIGPEAPHAYAFGPFVNRAHFAGLMVVVVPIALALVLADRRDSGRRQLVQGWADRLRRWNSTEGGPRRLVPFLILLMGGAALVSGSRGGVVALGAVLLSMIGLGAHGRSGVWRVSRLAVATGLIVLTGIWIGGDVLYGTVERLAEEIERTEESPRLLVWWDALKLWWQAPVVGTGLATFGNVYPQVRTVQQAVVFTHAESDWVQLLTDTGVLGLGLAVASAVAVGLALLAAHRAAAGPVSGNQALAGLVALLGTAVQGMVNFTLPVTSTFIYLALTLAIALRSVSHATPEQDSKA